MKIFPISQTAKVIAWDFRRPDGDKFELEGLSFIIDLQTPLGEIEIPSYSISPSGNILLCELPLEKQFETTYSAKIIIKQNGQKLKEMYFPDAFKLTTERLAPGSEYSGMSSELKDNEDMIRIVSIADFYLFEPIMPVAGADGYWYVNGRPIEIGGNKVPTNYKLAADEDGAIVIYYGEGADKRVVDTMTQIPDGIERIDEAIERSENVNADIVTIDKKNYITITDRNGNTKVVQIREGGDFNPQGLTEEGKELLVQFINTESDVKDKQNKLTYHQINNIDNAVTTRDYQSGETPKVSKTQVNKGYIVHRAIPLNAMPGDKYYFYEHPAFKLLTTHQGLFSYVFADGNEIAITIPDGFAERYKELYQRMDEITYRHDNQYAMAIYNKLGEEGCIKHCDRLSADTASPNFKIVNGKVVCVKAYNIRKQKFRCIEDEGSGSTKRHDIIMRFIFNNIEEGCHIINAKRCRGKRYYHWGGIRREKRTAWSLHLNELNHTTVFDVHPQCRRYRGIPTSFVYKKINGRSFVFVKDK